MYAPLPFLKQFFYSNQSLIVMNLSQEKQDHYMRYLLNQNFVSKRRWHGISLCRQNPWKQEGFKTLAQSHIFTWGTVYNHKVPGQGEESGSVSVGKLCKKLLRYNRRKDNREISVKPVS